MRILYLTPYLPYRDVRHAGGKTCYHYLEQVSKVHEVSLVSLYYPDELAPMDSLSFCSQLFMYPKQYRAQSRGDRVGRILRRLFAAALQPEMIFINPRNYQLLVSVLPKAIESFRPHLIQLEWPDSLPLVRFIRNNYSLLPLVSSIHESSSLRYSREYRRSTWDRPLQWILYHLVRRLEVTLLNQCNVVLVQNNDERLLLQNHGVKTPIKVIQPFFENPRNLSKTHKIPSSILFCGALYRKENFLSILWFAKNILPQIKSVVKDVKFYIVGARPPLKVLRLHDGITIFVISDVPNLAEYYQSCEIFVAPLLYGAGIKVKVLEAMAHGMPVITNDVGIEGIPAVAERDFVYYRTSSELRDKVLMLLTNSSLREEIGRNARQLITEHFDFDQSVQQLLALYKSLMVETPGHRSL